MKKGVAVLTAFTIGVSCCSMETAVMAAQNDGDGTEDTGTSIKEFALEGNSKPEIDWEKAFRILNDSVSGDPKIDKDVFDLEETEIQDEQTENQPEESKTEPEPKSLQMPEKFEVVIDPWETDGRGQVYSEQYVIQNTGKDVGILTLSNLTCKPQEGSGAVIRTDREGLHRDGRKSIYMEMLFGTGEKIVLSEEETEYETELKPGEELSVQFVGEVNEYASRVWENADVNVGVVYSWNTKEKMEDGKDREGLDEEVSEASGDAEGKEDASGDALTEEADKSGDALTEETDKSEDVSGDVLPGKMDKSGDVQEDPEMTEKSGDASEIKTDVDEGDSQGEKSAAEDSTEYDQQEGVRIVGLNLSKEEEIEVNPWSVDENEKISEVRYRLRNEGENSGTLTLSDLKCNAKNQVGISARIKTEKDAEPQAAEELANDLKNAGENVVFIEFLPEEERKTDEAEKEQSDFDYKVQLEPGEEIILCITGRLNEIGPEELLNGEIAVTVRYSWLPFTR